MGDSARALSVAGKVIVESNESNNANDLLITVVRKIGSSSRRRDRNREKAAITLPIEACSCRFAA